MGVGPDGFPVFQLDGGEMQSLMESLNLLARTMQNALELTYPEIYNLKDFEHPESRYAKRGSSDPSSPEGSGCKGAQVGSSDESSVVVEKTGAAGGGTDGSSSLVSGESGPSGGERLLRGQRVIVHGLQQSPQYNDQVGVVVKYLKDKQRYRVFLGPSFSNKHLALRPDCVRVCPDDETFLAHTTAVPGGAALESLDVELEGERLRLLAVNMVNLSGWTPLHACCHTPGYAKAGRRVVDAVVSSGGSLDIQTTKGPGTMHGWTPLHIASAYCVESMVEKLLEAKANVGVKQGDSGWTAVQTACRRGYVNVLRMLLDAKADPEEALPATPDSPSPAHNCVAMAARHGHLRCLQVLHESGASLDAANSLGWAALHEACNISNHDVVKFLISAGCDVNAKTRSGRNALYLCQRDPLLQDILREAGIEEPPTARPTSSTAEAVNSGDPAGSSAVEETKTQESSRPGPGETKSGISGRPTQRSESKVDDEKFRLLGDLPDLAVGNTLGPSARQEQEHAVRARQGNKSRKRKKSKSKSKLVAQLRSNNAPVGCPEDFTCDLTGSLLACASMCLKQTAIPESSPDTTVLLAQNRKFAPRPCQITLRKRF